MRRSLCLRWLPVMVASQSTHCLCLQTTSTVPSMTVRRLVAGHHMSLYRVRYCGFAFLLPFSHVHICVGGYPSSAASDLASCSSIADAVRMRARYDALHALQNRALRVRSLPHGARALPQTLHCSVQQALEQARNQVLELADKVEGETTCDGAGAVWVLCCQARQTERAMQAVLSPLARLSELLRSVNRLC